jgi:hypothetical protein
MTEYDSSNFLKRNLREVKSMHESLAILDKTFQLVILTFNNYSLLNSSSEVNNSDASEIGFLFLTFCSPYYSKI